MSQLSIFEVLQQVANNIPGCLMTSVVDADSGMSLASVTPDDAVDAASADAFHSDLYRLVHRSMQTLDSPQAVDGLVLVGEHAIFLSIPFPNSTYFWHMVTDLDTTVGFTQALMRKYSGPVMQSMSAVLV